MHNDDTQVHTIPSYTYATYMMMHRKGMQAQTAFTITCVLLLLLLLLLQQRLQMPLLL
jgi:hypothetical protein